MSKRHDVLVYEAQGEFYVGECDCGETWTERNPLVIEHEWQRHAGALNKYLAATFARDGSRGAA
jgi:hypothetical protein